jgi:hypothetical protein
MSVSNGGGTALADNGRLERAMITKDPDSCAATDDPY